MYILKTYASLIFVFLTLCLTIALGIFWLAILTISTDGGSSAFANAGLVLLLLPAAVMALFSVLITSLAFEKKLRILGFIASFIPSLFFVTAFLGLFFVRSLEKNYGIYWFLLASGFFCLLYFLLRRVRQ